jgi:pimeloyl-ACP methyl ester carboxylesterase
VCATGQVGTRHHEAAQAIRTRKLGGPASGFSVGGINNNNEPTAMVSRYLSAGVRHLVCPQPKLIGRDSYEGDSTPTLYETLAGAASDADTPVLLWLPGSGQVPDNELLRRLANALHAAEARVVIRSAPYDEAAATLAQLHKAGARRIFLGGHSRGGALACHMSATPPRGCHIAGVCTINPAPTQAAAAWIDCLTIVGEQDGGGALLGPGFAWPAGDRVHFRSDDDTSRALLARPPGVAPAGCDRLTLIARCGDHSLRWWAGGMAEKDDALHSRDTAAMNRAVVLWVKAFLEEPRGLSRRASGDDAVGDARTEETTPVGGESRRPRRGRGGCVLA